MATCGACGRPCRVTQHALVAQPDGGVTRKRVCNDCFGGAIHLCPSVTQVQKGVDEQKVQRRDAAEITKSACKKLRMLAKGYAAAASAGGFANGRATGLEQAADILEAGDY
jgi:hypothetical protein